MWNYAFIDWQNLYRWTQIEWWSIDFQKFRKYLSDKYKIEKAYYFIWFSQNNNIWLYQNLQNAWFIVVFKQQSLLLETNKKWNVDSDLVFYTMKSLIDDVNDFDKIILVSWDWDFKILVDYLLEKNRFLKVLFPCKKYASSLYKKLWNHYFSHLSDVKSYISF